MSHPRALRFGVQLSGGTGTDWLGQVRQAEELGYSSVFVPDHFGDQLAPIPTLTAAAAATTDLRVGLAGVRQRLPAPRAARQGDRQPRRAVGRPGRVRPGRRVDELRLRPVRHRRTTAPACGSTGSRRPSPSSRRLFAEGPTSFSGDHYTVTGLDGLPKPVQQPHPPFLIGGGAPRVLRLAGREADIVGVNPAIRSGNVDEDAGRDMAPEHHRPQAGVGARGRWRPLRRHRAEHAGVRRHRHRRPRRPASPSWRHASASAPRSSPTRRTSGSAPPPRSPTTSAAGATAGASPTGSSRAPRSRPWPPSSPSSPAPDRPEPTTPNPLWVRLAGS